MKQIDDNKIDLIYCDILYNTGKSFKDYDDNLGTTKEAIEWYKPRIKEMYRILKETGQIYLHMDFRLSHYMKILLDDIFGEKRFINEIIWSYRTGGVSKKRFQRKHDTILRYSKSKKYTHNSLLEKSYMESSGFKNAKIDSPSSKKLGLKRDENGVYRNVHMRDVWDINIIYNQDKQSVGYFSQKPKELLERIIKASSNEGDIVADFFCGSGTTGVVAKELNRKFIGCDISERAVEITKKRLDKVLDK
jgi:site-specific DNA-methyltransferase (adenine-specific)